MVVKYWLDDLPAELNSLERFLRDLLADINGLEAKFRYEFVRNQPDDLFAMAQPITSHDAFQT